MFSYDESEQEVSGYTYRRMKKNGKDVEAGKELAHPADGLRLILFSKVTGAFLLRTFGGFLHVPTTQIYCLTGAIISETQITNIYLKLQ